MYGTRITDISQNYHSGRRYNTQTFCLSLTQIGRVFSFSLTLIIVEWSNLSIIERKFPYSPLFPPVIHQRRKQLRIQVGDIYIGFSLIPQTASYTITDYGTQHTIIKNRSIVYIRQVFVRFYPFFTHPGFHPRTSITRMDDTYGYLEHLVQFACKEISGSRELGDCFRRSFLPNTFTVSQWFGRHLASYHKHTNFGISGSGNGIQRTNHRITITSAYPHIHIGLAGTKPYLTDQYIIDMYRLTIAHLYAVGTTIHRCLYLYFPVTRFIGNCRIFLSIP